MYRLESLHRTSITTTKFDMIRDVFPFLVDKGYIPITLVGLDENGAVVKASDRSDDGRSVLFAIINEED